MSHPTIHKGDTGSEVAYCQERLNVHGFVTTVDGIFGANTETQVKAFQGAKGLAVDGIVGPNTWAALEASPTVSTVPAYEDLDELSRRMLVEIAAYIGWDYSQGTASLVALPSRLAPSDVVWVTGKKTDTVCCVLVAGVVGRVYDKTAHWTANAWSNFMIPANKPWGMIEECVAAGIGKEYAGTPQAGKWYVVQKWTGLVNGQIVEGSSGHQWIQWGPDMLIEANVSSDEDADGSATDEGAVAWKHKTWNQNPANVRLVELFAF